MYHAWHIDFYLEEPFSFLDSQGIFVKSALFKNTLLVTEPESRIRLFAFELERHNITGMHYSSRTTRGLGLKSNSMSSIIFRVSNFNTNSILKFPPEANTLLRTTELVRIRCIDYLSSDS